MRCVFLNKRDVRWQPKNEESARENFNEQKNWYTSDQMPMTKKALMNAGVGVVFLEWSASEPPIKVFLPGRKIIVSDDPAEVSRLRRSLGLDGVDVLPLTGISPTEVAGAIVFGEVPLRLACLAKEVRTVDENSKFHKYTVNGH